jgi:hypothetical protein
MPDSKELHKEADEERAKADRLENAATKQDEAKKEAKK